jgi:hypothetical protein
MVGIDSPPPKIRPSIRYRAWTRGNLGSRSSAVPRATCFALSSDWNSEGIATGQRALGKLLELEAILEAESGWVSDSLFAIGISLCGRGDAKNGVSLVSAARRMYREDGIAEWTIEQALVGRIEKSARAVLGDEGYEAAVRSSEGMPRDDAIELAVSIATD